VQQCRPRVQPGEVELEIRGVQRHRGHVGPAADVDAQVDVAGAGGDVVQAEAQIGQGRDVGEQVIGAAGNVGDGEVAVGAGDGGEGDPAPIALVDERRQRRGG